VKKIVSLVFLSAIVISLILSGCGSTTGEAKGGKPGGGPQPACNDGEDNDGDNLCDYLGCWLGRGKDKVWMASDPGCDSAEDTDEYNAYCGDSACNDDETCLTCPSDCGDCPSYCGDGSCNGGENCATCPVDCGYCPPVCGNGDCEINESCVNCEEDCGVCPIPDSCSDTDGGLVIQVKGTVSGYLDGATYTYTDSCTGTTLKEWYCSSNRV
jgi:hypothetical protein